MAIGNVVEIEYYGRGEDIEFPYSEYSPNEILGMVYGNRMTPAEAIWALETRLRTCKEEKIHLRFCPPWNLTQGLVNWIIKELKAAFPSGEFDKEIEDWVIEGAEAELSTRKAIISPDIWFHPPELPASGLPELIQARKELQASGLPEVIQALKALKKEIREDERVIEELKAAFPEIEALPEPAPYTQAPEEAQAAVTASGLTDVEIINLLEPYIEINKTIKDKTIYAKKRGTTLVAIFDKIKDITGSYERARLFMKQNMSGVETSLNKNRPRHKYHD